MLVLGLPYPEVRGELFESLLWCPTDDPSVKLDTEISTSVDGGAERLGHTMSSKQCRNMCNSKGSGDNSARP